MPVLTVLEAARQIGCDEKHVQRLIREGRIPTLYTLSARKTGYRIDADVLASLGDLRPDASKNNGRRRTRHDERQHVRTKPELPILESEGEFIKKCFNKSWWSR